MTRIIYIQHDGREDPVDLPVGYTLMQGAVLNDIPGIAAECGGAAACGTCRVQLAPDWVTHVPAAEEIELSILDDADTSWRLSCQITVMAEMDGMVVHLPENQT
ncbi:2Fe-2S ferredoxin [Acidocella aquatica]|uniref:2Fe-2S ferredoxin n=1 Tax=Acidocella aquatica TaxID=1922313 RepID=A0ABQ6A875_9PROT|nr:2Fe-2S iron-sulfur cluster-binding protein [Acidocella aquatica]GLR68419.1 2Fe-2S ferredoxin [Acidocella aquatica]